MKEKRNFKKNCILFVLIFLSVACFSNSKNLEESKRKRETLVNYAKEFIGVPYVYGGLDKTGIDCSGLIYTVSRESIQLQLPRTVAALYGFVKIIPDNQREAGDILFFKTVGDRVSHAGIYVGNNQFIHAASDGPNTGVILSSLSETYWKEHYYAVGQILPSTLVAGQEQKVEDKITLSESNKTLDFSGEDFVSHLKLDVSGFFNWNFFNMNQMLLNPRGFSLQGNVSYTKGQLWPGVGIELKYDSKLKTFHMPITFSLGVSEYFRFYAGPVISFGNSVLPGTEKIIKASVFPGILGFSWQSNSFDVSDYGISFVQDISYSVFNSEDGSALSFVESIVSGLIFSTGVRVTFPTL